MNRQRLILGVAGPAILAIAIIVLGFSLKAGIDNFTNRDRRVTVKGLSEREVEADKVTWPIMTKDAGNDLSDLYERVERTQQKIKRFLMEHGIKENEITINAPKVDDNVVDAYDPSRIVNRYNMTSVVTVISRNVKVVQAALKARGKLLQEGIAVLSDDYENSISYEYISFKDMKPKMLEEAIANAQLAADQFAKNSKSKLNKIVSADQGQFSIEDRDENTPEIKKVRVVTTITYSLKD